MHMPDKRNASGAESMFTWKNPFKLQCRKAQMGMIMFSLPFNFMIYMVIFAQ